MILEGGVWSVMQSLKVDELIASKTSHDSFLRKVIPRSRAYRHERFEFSPGANLTMVLDRRDYSQWRVFAGGLRINKKLFHYFNVNPFRFDIVDIGANIGGYSALFSLEVDVEHFNVHVFEPNPLIIDGLAENMRRLESSNITVNAHVNAYALGEHKGRLPLKVNENHSGVSTFGNTKREFTRTIDVDVSTLDSYVAEKNIDHIDLIKIDVEAFEPSVLFGARQTIAYLKPAIYFEFQKAWFDTYPDDFITEVIYLLSGNGYRFYREARDGMLHPFTMTARSLKDFQHLNILAVARPLPN